MTITKYLCDALQLLDNTAPFVYFVIFLLALIINTVFIIRFYNYNKKAFIGYYAGIAILLGFITLFTHSGLNIYINLFTFYIWVVEPIIGFIVIFKGFMESDFCS